MSTNKTNASTPNKNNKEYVYNKFQAGLENMNEPRLVGEILLEYFSTSNEPLAVAFRQQHPEVFGKATGKDEGSDQLFKNLFPNTELGVDLKLLTRTCGRVKIGEVRPGAITRDGEDHFTFFESALKGKMDSANKRNPHVLELNRINVNKKDDGTLYPTFNRPRYSENFTFQDLCREAAEELLMVAGEFDRLCLVEEGISK